MSKATKKSIVQPDIQVKNETVEHPLVTNFEDKELKAVGYARVAGSNSWVSYVITTKGSEVLNIAVSEPNMRGIAEDSAKVSFVHEFMDVE